MLKDKERLKFKKIYIILTDHDEGEEEIGGDVYTKKGVAERQYKEYTAEAKHYYDNGMDMISGKFELIEVDYQSCKLIKKDEFKLFGGE